MTASETTAVQKPQGRQTALSGEDFATREKRGFASRRKLNFVSAAKLILWVDVRGEEVDFRRRR
jgi:hypothetical protein